MKVLYIDHPESDYLSTVVYLGLCQELGAENVVDWPWKATFHGQTYEGPIPYGPNARGVAAPFPWMPPQPGRPWANEEVADHIGDFDLVVLASPRAYNTAALDRLMVRMGRASFRRLVMLDGEDYTTVRWDLVDQFRFDRYFKTSMVTHPHEVHHEQKARLEGTIRVIPFPMATPIGEIAPVEKDIDLCFLGGGNWRGSRREGAHQGPLLKMDLETFLKPHFQSFVCGHLSHEEFISTVNRSKVAICVGGQGIEPLRTYEILSCPGTLLARERIDVITPYPLIDWVTHVPFDSMDWSGLVEIIKRYLGNDSARAEVAAAGNALLKAHYTPCARARQLLQESFA